MFTPVTKREQAIKFLEEAARYFENRPVNGEDRAYWSNVFNSDRCKQIAERIKNDDWKE